MNTPLDYLNRFLHSRLSEDLGWVLVHSLWQITLVAALYALVAMVLRNRSAVLRYLLGCAAMVAMLLLPVVTYGVLPDEVTSPPVVASSESLVEPGDEPLGPIMVDSGELVPQEDTVGEPSTSAANFASSPIITAEEPFSLATVSQAVRPWLPTASAVWLLGVLTLSLRPLAGWFRVRRLRTKGVSPLSESTGRVCDRLVGRLGIRHAVEFAQSTLVQTPAVVGFFRPIVLLPVSTIAGLTPAELELILAHELAHIRRHDYLVNLAQTVLEALLFYHPAMWWVSSQVRRERENCCDDMAVALSGDRATYIRALAQLEEHRIAAPALAATGGSLLMRVRRLLGMPTTEFGYRNTTTWLAGLLLIALVGATLANTNPDAESSSSREALPELTSSQEAEIAEWVEKAISGKWTQEQFNDSLKELGPESVRALVPLMKSGKTDRIAMGGFEQFLDEPAVVDYLVEVLRELAKNPNKPPNTAHCCLCVLAKCGEEEHVDLAAEFLKEKPIAALLALSGIGGERAVDHLIAAFEAAPTDLWWLFAEHLQTLGDPAALPELKRRLREVEVPPNDRFPNRTVGAFTDAIYAFSGGEQTNSQYQQGFEFAYPYNKGGLPKSFTVSRVSDHYIQLPKTDPASAQGRKKLWEAIRDQTPGPGFTIDGDDMVLLNGLRAIPLNRQGSAKVDSADKFLCEKTIEDFERLFAPANASDRVPIPGDGWLVTMDPKQMVHLLRLRKTTDDFQYNVYFARRLPLAVASVATPKGSGDDPASVTIQEVAYWQDGGSLGVRLSINEKKPAEMFSVDGQKPWEEDSRKTTLRLYVDAMHPSQEGAKLLAADSPEERRLLDALRQWLTKNYTDEELKRIASSGLDVLNEKEVWAKRIASTLRSIKRYRAEKAEVEGAEEKEKVNRHGANKGVRNLFS